MNLTKALLTAVCVLAASCASVASPSLDESLTTGDGAIIKLERCSTSIIASEYTYQLVNLSVVVHGRERANPRFVFVKGGVESAFARAATITVEELGDTFMWACAEMSKESRVAGRPVTPRDKYLFDFHDEAMAATVDAALQFERETTNEGYNRVGKAAQARVNSFREQEPDSWSGGF